MIFTLCASGAKCKNTLHCTQITWPWQSKFKGCSTGLQDFPPLFCIHVWYICNEVALYFIGDLQEVANKNITFEKPQNPRVQKAMSQRSTGSCTHCTRANEFPGLSTYTAWKIKHCFTLFWQYRYFLMMKELKMKNYLHKE